MLPFSCSLIRLTSICPSYRSRNTAFLAILGVVGGAYGIFRYQSPQKGHGLVKDDDRASMDGPAKLGRSKIVSQDDVKAMMGDPPRGQGNVGRSPGEARDR